MRQQTISRFLESNIPEAETIKTEYHSHFWEATSREILSWGKKRIRELGFAPDSMSPELANFLFKEARG